MLNKLYLLIIITSRALSSLSLSICSVGRDTAINMRITAILSVSCQRPKTTFTISRWARECFLPRLSHESGYLTASSCEWKKTTMKKASKPRKKQTTRSKVNKTNGIPSGRVGCEGLGGWDTMVGRLKCAVWLCKINKFCTENW